MRRIYCAFIPEMPRAWQPGREKTNRKQRISWAFLFLLIILSSCCSNKPNLNLSYLPETYNIKETDSNLVNESSQTFNILCLNDDYRLNEKIIQFWLDGAFNQHFEKQHPVVQFDRNDVIALRDSLYRLFTIYYVKSEHIISPGISLLKTYMIHQNGCDPLTNYEIQFMMNNTIENAFPRVPFTMLIISSLELITQKGGIPIYPKVHSEYLRQTLDLPALDPIAGANLFATKSDNSVYSRKTEGFVFCRRKKN